MRVTTATTQQEHPNMLTATVKPSHNQPTAHPAQSSTGNRPNPA